MELADLDRVPSRPSGHSRLLRVLCKIPHHKKHALGELVDVRDSRMAVVDWSAQGFRELGPLPRKSRWPNPCGVEPWGRCFLWICNDVCFAPITSGGGRT